MASTSSWIRARFAPDGQTAYVVTATATGDNDTSKSFVYSLNASSSAASPPRLRIALSGGKVVLSWPYPSVGFQLQAASAPTATGWTVVPQTPSVVAGENRVTLTATDSARLYRLSRR